MRRIGIILTAMMLMMTGMTAARAGQEGACEEENGAQPEETTEEAGEEGDIIIYNYDEASELKLFISSGEEELDYAGIITSEYVLDNSTWTLSIVNDELVIDEIHSQW